jgi:nitrogen fixation NifU-like protein
MSELRELYQEVIIDHGRHPRNFGAMPEANQHKDGFNPLCGDKITLHVQTEKDVVKKIMFEGCGCAISMASASLMSETMKEKTFAEFVAFFKAFHEVVTEGVQPDPEKLGKLAVLAGVAEFPARVKCATLAWHTMNALLTHESGVVSTEDKI